MIQATIAGVKKAAQALEVRVGGVNLPAKIAQIRIGGVVKTFWQDFSASASPSHVSGAASSSGSDDVLTSSTTAAPVGGTPPYTFLWSGGDADWQIDNDASATTAFLRIGLLSGSADSATFLCTITDAAGALVTTNTVTASARNIGTL